MHKNKLILLPWAGSKCILRALTHTLFWNPHFLFPRSATARATWKLTIRWYDRAMYIRKYLLIHHAHLCWETSETQAHPADGDDRNTLLACSTTTSGLHLACQTVATCTRA